MAEHFSQDPPSKSQTSNELADDQDITHLLRAWGTGDQQALDRLIPLVTGELRSLAGAYLRQQPQGHTLQPTALVNELYLRLAKKREGQWPDRTRFFAFAARTMRNILVDHARSRGAAKRGGDVTKVELNEALDGDRGNVVDLIALDEALRRLSELDPRQSRIVELRAFAGLSLAQTAEVLEVSPATVSRDWAMAKAWLYRQLTYRTEREDG